MMQIFDGAAETALLEIGSDEAVRAVFRTCYPVVAEVYVTRIRHPRRAALSAACRGGPSS